MTSETSDILYTIKNPLFTKNDSIELLNTHYKARKIQKIRDMKPVISASVLSLLHRVKESNSKEQFKTLVATEANPCNLEIEIYRYRRTLLRRPANEIYDEHFPWLSTVSDVAKSSLEDMNVCHLVLDPALRRQLNIEQLTTPLWRVLTYDTDALPLLSLCMGANMKVVSRIQPEILHSFGGKIEIRDVSLVLKYFPNGMRADEKACLDEVYNRWNLSSIPPNLCCATSEIFDWGGEDYTREYECFV